jgi:hypothetical protein
MNTVPTSDPNDVDKAAEERYTQQFLDGLGDYAMQWDEELIDPYAIFYSGNVKAGYAFHMLQHIFKKIDAFIGIESNTQSPWAYFSSLESLVSFGKAIEALTKGAQGVNEPPVIEKIRIADRTRMRRAMLKRITDLEPSRRAFDAEVLDYLIDRNAIFDNFLKAVYKRRAVKQDPNVTGKMEAAPSCEYVHSFKLCLQNDAGLRQRKPKNVTSAMRSRGGTEKRSTLRGNSPEKKTEARERIPNSSKLPSQIHHIRRLRNFKQGNLYISE